MTQEIKTIKISDLHLWTENPRDPIGEDIGDLEIIKKAIKNDDKKWNIPKLIDSMGAFYHFNKLPIIVLKDNKHIVYDGNCRIAILKYLQNPEWGAEIERSLFPSGEPGELKNLKEIPCNLCDEKTALEIIYHDNLANNTWTPLSQSYFEHYHLNEAKSLFLEFEEITGLISKHHKLNQRFVKDEVLTKNNLSEIGISIKNEKLLSSNSNSDFLKILKELILAIDNGTISTRNNNKKGSTRLSPTGGLKNVIEKSSKSNFKIDSFNLQKSEEIDKEDIIKNGDFSLLNDNPTRKTPRNKEVKDILFDQTLSLRQGSINDLYSILDDIYNKNKNDKNILPVIGISLRLIMEVAGREYFRSINDINMAKKDIIFCDFMKVIRKDGILKQTQKNLLGLDNTETLTVDKFEGLIGKYAHANIEYDKTNILNCSKIIGKILTHYFFKNN